MPAPDAILSALPALPALPGEVFAERFRVDSLLGVGGMGAVLAATPLDGTSRVAIKVLLPSMAENLEMRARFLREGRAVMAMSSEHIARVFEVGETPVPYIVMEYLAGADLAHLLEERGRFTAAEAVDLVVQACDAIGEAHARQIVHRDLKPSNLFVAKLASGAEQVKVLDFGISKIGKLDPGSLAMTRTTTMMGSPLYMSPEQLKSAKNVDARADIWALGVILFELISGAPPFRAETIAELGAIVLSGPAPWLGDAAPDVPAELAAIVNTCLQRSADDRFANVADLADALVPFGSESTAVAADRAVARVGLPSSRARIVARAESSDHLALARTTPSDPRLIPARAIASVESVRPSVDRTPVVVPPVRRARWRSAVLAVVVVGGAVAGQRALAHRTERAELPAAPVAAPIVTAERAPEPSASAAAIVAAEPSAAPTVSSRPARIAPKPARSLGPPGLAPASASASPRPVPTSDFARSAKD